jgi:hypothetical protein
MIKRLVDAYNSGKTMSGFLPCPQELLDRDAPNRETGSATDALADKYGAVDWYGWALANWGTKWDFGAEEGDAVTVDEGSNEVSLGFDTAWSPPIAFYQAMEDKFGFHVRASYFEPGMSFVGEYEGGSDDYFDYDEDLEGVPQHLIDHYDINSYLGDEENLDIDLDDGLSATNEDAK